MNDQMNQPEPRIRKRRRQRKGSARAIWGVLALAFFVGLLWGGWGLLGPNSASIDTDTTVVKVGADDPLNEPEKTTISQRTFIAFGVNETDGVKTLVGAVQVVFDPAQNRIGGLYLDSATFGFVPGRGLESLADAYVEGPEVVAAAVVDIVGVESEGYLVVSDTAFDRLKETKDVAELFNGYSDGNVSREDSKDLAGQMGAISSDRINLYDLPVRQLNIGETLYLEPVKDELTRLVKGIWGQTPEKKHDKLRVIILNGNGAPGVGRKAADMLGGEEYKIIDVKNADHFDYEKTKIVLYADTTKKTGKAIARDLRLGEVVEESMAQDVTDVVIILGKDFI